MIRFSSHLRYFSVVPATDRGRCFGLTISDWLIVHVLEATLVLGVPGCVEDFSIIVLWCQRCTAISIPMKKDKSQITFAPTE
jgi:hypothetical protein